MSNSEFQVWFAQQTAATGDRFAQCDAAADEMAALIARAEAIMASELYAKAE